MNRISTSNGTTGDTTDRFPSLGSLRAVHGELLKRRRESGDTAEFLDEATSFVRRAQVTGVLLDSNEDRQAAQSLLDYWANALYRAGREAPEATLADFDPALAQAQELDDALHPYLGLNAFGEADKDRFFGRQRLTEKLIDTLKENRLLAVVGPSGSGKSSLVLAGLLPALKGGVLPGSEGWRYYAPMVPGSSPLANLARVLRPPKVDVPGWNRQQIERFQQDNGHLAQLAGELNDRPVVLVVDQFEEIFTLCHDDSIRQAFINNLLGLVQSPGPRHTVILTMRVDFEPYVTRLPAFQDLFGQVEVPLTPLSAGELREAIEKPAAAVGLKFEEGVVDALLHDILGEPAALPLLQFTLLKLWEEREGNWVTWEAYRRLGSGRQALARSADEFYERLIPEEQVTAKRILLRMVRPGEGLEVTSNRIRRQTLYQAGEARDRMDRVLNRLIQARLVRLTEEETPGDAQIEVAHEALVRNWPRLVGWLEEERATLTTRQRLEARAAEWVRLGSGRGGLLDEVELFEAERWLESPSAADLGYSETLTALVRASQTAQKETVARQRRAARFRLAALGTIIVLIIAILVAITVSSRRLAQQQSEAKETAEFLAQVAQTAEAEAHAAETEAERIAAELQSLNLAEDAQQASSSGDGDTALALALMANTVVISPSTQARQALTAVAYASATRRRLEQGAPVYSVAFSPDGRNALSGSEDGSLILWNLESGVEIHRLVGHTDRVWSVAINSDGDTALSASEDGSLILWNLESGEEIRRFEGHTDAPLSVAFSPDGHTALSGSKDRSLILWDLESGRKIRRFIGHTDWVWSVAFLDGHRALSGSEDGSLILWDVENGRQTDYLEGLYPEGVRAVAISADGRTALLGSYDGSLIVWDIENQWERKRLYGHTAAVLSLAFSPDGHTALSGSEDSNLILWDIESGRDIRRFGGHADWVRAVAFSPDGRMALSGSADGSLRLWDVESGEKILHSANIEIYRSSEYTSWVGAVAFSPDGHTALSGFADGSLIVWDPESGEEIRRFEEPAGAVYRVAFSSDGNTALSGSENGTLFLWDIASGEESRRFEGHTGGVLSVAFSPDGRTALSGSYDGSLIQWDIASGTEASRSYGYAGWVSSMAFSPDGRTALLGIYDGSLIHWDIASGTEISRLQGYAGAVYDVAFSPDGNTALSGSENGTLILWDIASGSAIYRFPGHTDAVYSVAFSPDGRTALSGSADGSLILWDIAGRTEIRRLEGYAGAVYDVAFSPDGNTALSGSANGTLILWDIEAIRRTVRSVAFSPDGHTALSGLEDGSLILWDIASGTEIRHFAGHTDRVWSVAFSLDEDTALSGSEDGSLILWDISSRTEISRFEAYSGTVYSVAFSPLSRTALLGPRDGGLILWDLTGKEAHRFEAYSGTVLSVAFSPISLTALSGSADGSLILWDIASGTEIRRFVGHTDEVWGVAISPDGCTALSGSYDGSLIHWDIASGAEIRRLEGYAGAAYGVAFSPDGNTALSGSADGSLILWDIASGSAIYRFPGHTDAVYSVAFGPDGNTALSGSADGSLILWHIHLLDNLNELKEWLHANRYVRDLTCAEQEQYRLTLVPCTPTPTPTATPALAATPTATPAAAQEAHPGDNRGAIPVGGGQVWTYHGQAREALRIRVSADRPANMVPDQERLERELLDTFLIVYAPDGTILAEQDDIVPGTMTDSSIEMLVLPDDGVYRIVVRSLANLTGGTYTLTLTELSVGQISFGETVTGVVELAGDCALWMFEGTEGQAITVMMNKDNSNLDAYLTLLGPDGKELIWNDDSGGDYNAMIGDFVLPETDIYTIIAGGYGESVGAYTLTLVGRTQQQ